MKRDLVPSGVGDLGSEMALERRDGNWREFRIVVIVAADLENGGLTA